MHIVIVVLALASFAAVPAHAQSSTQAGVLYSAIAQEYPDQSRSGVGGFVVYSPVPWFGVDASTSLFFSEDVGGYAWQLLAGPRLGMLWNDLAIFGRVRPGLVRFSERFFKPNIACILIFPPPESCLAPHSNFALDIGGTVELPLNNSTALRFELGDTLIRYDRKSLDAEWMHNLQFAGGLGWRF
jgi:hypothetical protein